MFSKKKLLGKILGNVGWLFVDKVIQLFLGLVLWVYLARYLGPEQFGAFSYALAYVSIFGVIATLGMNGILVRDLVKGAAELEVVMGTAFVLRFMAAITVALIMGVSAYLLKGDEVVTTVIAILGLTFIFKSCEVIKYHYEANVQSKYWVWVEGGVFILAFLLKVLVVHYGGGLPSLAVVMLVESVTVSLLIYYVYFYATVTTASWRVSWNYGRRLLSDSWPLIISGGAIILYMKIDQIMLGELMDEKAVAEYSIASKISEAWYFIPVILNASIRPSLIRLRERNYELYIQRLQQVFSVMIWGSVVVSIFVMLLSDVFVEYLFGDVYSASAGVLSVHIWAGVFVFINNTAWIWYYSEEKQKLASYRILLGLVVNVLLNLLLIPSYGVLGAAWATLLSRAVVSYFGHLLNRETAPLFFVISKSLLFIK